MDHIPKAVKGTVEEIITLKNGKNNMDYMLKTLELEVGMCVCVCVCVCV